MPSDTDVLPELDLGEPPKELLEWAKENLNEVPETRCQILNEFRDLIYGKQLLCNQVHFTFNEKFPLLYRKIKSIHI